MLLLAALHLSMARPEEAKVSLQRCVKGAPNDTAALALLGLVENAKGNFVEAVQYCENGITHFEHGIKIKNEKEKAENDSRHKRQALDRQYSNIHIANEAHGALQDKREAKAIFKGNGSSQIANFIKDIEEEQKADKIMHGEEKHFGLLSITKPPHAAALLHMVMGDAKKAISIIAQKRTEEEFEKSQYERAYKAKQEEEKERLRRVGREDLIDSVEVAIGTLPIEDLAEGGWGPNERGYFDKSLEKETASFREDLRQYGVSKEEVNKMELTVMGTDPPETYHKRGKILHEVTTDLRAQYVDEYHASVVGHTDWSMRYMGIGLHRLKGAHLLACLSSILSLAEENSFLAVTSGLDMGQIEANSHVEAKDAIGIDRDEGLEVRTELQEAIPAGLYSLMMEILLGRDNAQEAEQEAVDEAIKGECAALWEDVQKLHSEETKLVRVKSNIMSEAAHNSMPDVRSGLTDPEQPFRKLRDMRLDNPGKEIFPSREATREDGSTVSLGTFLNMPRLDTKPRGDSETGAWKDGVDLAPRKGSRPPAGVMSHEELSRMNREIAKEKAMHREYKAKIKGVAFNIQPNMNPDEATRQEEEALHPQDPKQGAPDLLADMSLADRTAKILEVTNQRYWRDFWSVPESEMLKGTACRLDVPEWGLAPTQEQVARQVHDHKQKKEALENDVLAIGGVKKKNARARFRFDIKSETKVDFMPVTDAYFGVNTPCRKTQHTQREKWNKNFKSRLDDAISEVGIFCDLNLSKAGNDFDAKVASVDDELLHEDLEYRMKSAFASLDVEARQGHAWEQDD